MRTLVTAALLAALLAPAAQAAPARPDLKIAKGAATPREAAPGGQITVTWTIFNGGKKAAGKSTTDLVLSTDAKLDKKDLKLASVTEKALKARKTAAHSLKVKIPAKATARRYTLLVCADARGKVRESGEKNNCRAAAAITVAAARTTTPPPAAPPVAVIASTPFPAPPTPAALRTTITEAPAATSAAQSARFAFTANRAGSTFQCRLDDAAFAPCASPKTYGDVLAGFHVFEVRATDPAGEQEASPARHSWRIAFEAPAPGPAERAAPAPETRATTAPEGEMTLVSDTTEFLYKGADPIQKQVKTDAIAPTRASVLRGRVTRRNGTPVDGVRVTVLDHPELGQTATRADGGYEIAVNGGGSVTLAFEREGYVPSQRQLEVPTQEFERVDEIVLIPYDDQVTGVDLTDAKLQVAQGAAVTDGDGTRKATLLLEPGTDAVATLPNGQEKPLGDRLNIRATEFTIGTTGPAAMPGELPPTSAYTYAVEYSVDEADKLRAVDVQFDKPVVTYVDNYLKFPAGTAVPMGYYDREKGQWVPAPSGVVIAIVSESNGRANVDTNGDGVADNRGLDDAERRKLAELYDPGKSLWRAAIDHFTPWDYNWPYGLPDGAAGPDQDGPDDGDPPGDDPCGQGGSIILCENQVLGEQLAVAGTPYSLVYQSDRVPGRRTGDSLEIPLTGATPPSSLARVDLTLEVAGRTIKKSFTPAPNLNETFVFDGKDAYGRVVQGKQNVDVEIAYVYQALYREPGAFTTSFSALGGQTISGNRTRQEISISQRWSGTVGGLNAPPSALAGWSVDAHHTYDPIGRTLYLGDGTKRSADGQNFDVISTTKAGLAFPEGLAAAPDGTLYVADSTADVVRRIAPDGTLTVVAGTGTAGFSGDGGPATSARLSHPADVALDVDGSIVIADEGNDRVRRVSPDGVITTVAGSGASGYSGDGGPATAARLDEPSDVAMDTEGALYIVDRANHALRRVGADGTIATLAGNGSPGARGDGGLATRAQLHSPRDVALRGDGSVYVADAGNHRVRRIDADGTIETIAGTGSAGYSGDGGAATDAELDTPSAILPLRDGGLLVADAGNAVLREVGSDASITTVGGNGTPGFRGDGGPAAQARIDYPQAIALGPDDTIYLADAGNDRIRALGPSLPGLSVGEFTIAAEDGRSLYVFDRNGRHLRTVDALTRAVTVRFSYDARGRLTGIEDADGQRTTIQRTAAGDPSAIVGPYGQTTALQVTGGYLSRVTNPAGDRVALEYGATGLLTKLTDPRDGVHAFAYDALGRLTRDTAADGSFQTLTRTVGGGAVTVVHRTGEGRSTTYSVKRTPDGEIKRTVTDAGGRSTVTLTGNDGVKTVVHSDGTRVTQELGPDPRFGMQSPVLTRTTITTPGGLRSSIETARTVELDNPADVLSVRRATETASINGRVRTSRYDAASRRFTDSAPSGRTLTTEVDAKGRPTHVEVAGVTPATYAYDARGRLTRAAQGPRAETYTYDDRGRVATITDALSRTTTFSYDLADRPASIERADGRTVGYSYDRNGNVLSVTPPGRAAHTFGYDARELLQRYTPPTAAPTTYAFDRDGLVTGVTRPGGEALGYEYDDAARLTRITAPNGTTRFTYAPETGRLTAVVAPGDEGLAFAYDGSLPTKTTFSGTVSGTVAFGYDADLRLASETVNGAGAAAYTYDDDGLLLKAGALTLAHDADHGLVSSLTVGGTATTVARNGFGEPDTVATKQGSTTLYTESYGRDAGGRITTKTVTRGSTSNTFAYAYDGADRLQEVKRDGAVQATYAYDANGNRTRVERAGEAALDATYDDQDRLVGFGASAYTYTPAGELATKTTGTDVTRYTYDAAGALTGVTLPSGTAITYAIDAGGRRVAVKRDGVLERGFLYGRGTGPVAELAADGALRSRFVYATRGNVPDYMVQSGTTYRIVTDQLGSPRAVVNTANGTRVQEIDYDEFGRVTRDTNPGFQPFGFAGGLYDRDTGLVRFGARDYDPETGRFTAKDPLRFDGGDTNLYGYALGDPVNFADPSGMFLDTLADIAFIGYDLYQIGSSLVNGCGVSGTDLLALGADIAGAAIPFATGGGALVRAGAHAADAAPLIKAGTRGGETAGKAFPKSVKDAARAENPTATCVYCARPGTGTQVDHAIPKARGGDATLDNAQLACPHCNASKGAGDFPKSPPPGYEGPWPPPHWPTGKP
ncbi:MAG TPA: RHS repeat-associated core domain-containing protein [Solirubrobacter sp.]|nr:RHS repeat-associated core domain-containing protein [Solirubrobacter sp.]